MQLGGGCDELEPDSEALPVTVAVERTDDDVMEASGDELDVEAAAAAGKPAGCKELEWDDSTLSY